MRLLILGLGNIGQRHARLAKKLGPKDGNYACLRSTAKQLYISDDLKSWPVENLAKELGFKELKNDSDILDFNPSHIIDARPPKYHFHNYLDLLPKLNGVLIEKPILIPSNFLYKKVVDMTKDTYYPIFVGYHLMHHPILKLVEKELEQEQPLNYTFEYYEHLNSMYSYRKIKEMHESSLEESGGPEYSFSHAIQLCNRIFSQNTSIEYLKRRKFSNNNIKCHDHSEIKLIHKIHRKENIIGNIIMNYLSHKKKQLLTINCKNSTHEVDFLNNKFRSFSNGCLAKENIYPISKIDLLEKQMNNFFNVTHTKEKNLVALKSNSTRMCHASEAIKISDMLQSKDTNE